MKMILVNFLKAFCYVVNVFLMIFLFIFIMRLILAWVGPDYTFELIGFLTEQTVNLTGEILHVPVLKYDIRPVFVIAFLLFLKFFIIWLIVDINRKVEETERPRGSLF